MKMLKGLLAGTAVLLLAVSTWVVHRASAQNTLGPGSLNGQPPLDGTITGVVTNNDGDPIQGAAIFFQWANLALQTVKPTVT